MEKILYYLHMLSPRLSFNFEFWILKKITWKINSLFAYPLIIYMEFNKEKMYLKYIKYNLSVKKQLINRSKTMSASMVRQINRSIEPESVSQDVCNRLYKWHEIRKHRKKQKEIDDFIKQFPDYKPNLNLYEKAEIIS